VERLEEYLETIYDIQKEKKRLVKTTEIAEKLKVKPASVTEMISKLSKEGYVDYQPYKGVTLTKKGEEIAKKIKGYHLVFEKFFRDFIGLDEKVAHEISCKIEHVVSDEVVERICSFISNSCSVCEECNYEVLPISEAKDGRYTVIVAPKYLESAGIKAGKDVEVKSGVIRVNNEELSVSEDVKRKILVVKAQ